MLLKDLWNKEILNDGVWLCTRKKQNSTIHIQKNTMTNQKIQDNKCTLDTFYKNYIAPFTNCTSISIKQQTQIQQLHRYDKM